MIRVYPPGAPIMAPIAGHTDIPFRRMIRKCGCRFAFTEMIDAGSLVFSAQKTLRLAQRADDEDFLGIQLVGSDLETLSAAARIVDGMRFDVLDFNLGCPAPKVAKKCEGAAFALRKPDDAARALETLVRASRIPVTAKTRVLSADDPAPTIDFCRKLQDAGAASITLHGRVMKAFYSGPVFHEAIQAVREALSIPVVANGGALTGEAYRELLEKTGCENGMIARGAIGNPWIFREALSPNAKPPTLPEFMETIRAFVDDSLSFYGKDYGYVVVRKSLLAFLRGRGFSGALRASVSALSDDASFEELMARIAHGPSERYWEQVSQRPELCERRLSPS